MERETDQYHRLELNCELLWTGIFPSTKSLDNRREIFLLSKAVWTEPLCSSSSLLWWHDLTAIFSAHSGPRLVHVHKSKFLNWKEIACDWFLFCFLWTMVYQREIRVFHQNVYLTPTFSPPFPSSCLTLTHTPSIWKRIFHFQLFSVFQLLMIMRDSPLLLFLCTPFTHFHPMRIRCLMPRAVAAILQLEEKAKRVPGYQLRLRCYVNSGTSFLHTYMRGLNYFIASILISTR